MTSKESTWTTRRNRWSTNQFKLARTQLEAAFADAFIKATQTGTCYFCGGSTGPDGKGNQVCNECGRIQ